jgi:hypothetical protein
VQRARVRNNDAFLHEHWARGSVHIQSNGATSTHENGREEYMKKAFDWEQCSKQHRPAHVAWLKANHDKPVTAVEYAEAYKELRASDNRPNNARRYSAAKLKGSYHNLRKTFGFFVNAEGASS